MPNDRSPHHGKRTDRARFGGTVQVPGGGDAETEQTFRIPNPALWSPETPALYTLETELYIGKRSIDREQTRFGIRKIVITPEGLRLNGKARFLRGVNRHQEYPTSATPSRTTPNGAMPGRSSKPVSTTSAPRITPPRQLFWMPATNTVSSFWSRSSAGSTSVTNDSRNTLCTAAEK